MEELVALKEGQIGHFSADGEFSVLLVNGEAKVLPRTACFIYDKQLPRFEHDCEKCLYLGHFDTYVEETNLAIPYDGYFCTQGPGPTVIARFSNNGPDYISGLAFKDKEPLASIHVIAQRLGLL